MTDMLTIEENRKHKFALHHLGFRPFFLLASAFAVVSVSVWSWLYHMHGTLPVNLTPLTWHGHEMIFGYGIAVTAGFLLTAVKNWTGIQTVNGPWLIMLSLLWLSARIMPFSGYTDALLVMAVSDISFNFFLCLAIAYPIVKVRQWRQLPVWSCLLVLLMANLWFYAGCMEDNNAYIHKSLRLGLYVLVMLVMLMGRRVIPFFIEKGTGLTIRNFRPIDAAINILLPVFIITGVFASLPAATSLLALLMAILIGIRLWGWFVAPLFSRPMIWILYLGYSWIAVGFALVAMPAAVTGNPILSFHAFAYGAIGALTLGMMSRVSLGHTGRDINEPRPALAAAFVCLLAGSLIRVFMPVFMPASYPLFIGISQAAWILSFALFFLIFCPVLLSARVDGRYG